jgi:hypothetical protein
VQPIIRNLTKQTYKAQIAIRERMSESLAMEFGAENLTLVQRAEVAHHWDKVLKEKHAFQFLLDLMERQEQEGLFKRQLLAVSDPRTFRTLSLWQGLDSALLSRGVQN